MPENVVAIPSMSKTRCFFVIAMLCQWNRRITSLFDFKLATSVEMIVLWSNRLRVVFPGMRGRRVRRVDWKVPLPVFEAVDVPGVIHLHRLNGLPCFLHGYRRAAPCGEEKSTSAIYPTKKQDDYIFISVVSIQLDCAGWS